MWKTALRFGLLNPNLLPALVRAFLSHGPNLMLLLAWVARVYPSRIAFSFENHSTSYREFYEKSLCLGSLWQQEKGLRPGKKIAFLLRNLPEDLVGLFAAASTGADIAVLSPHYKEEQLGEWLHSYPCDFVVAEGCGYRLPGQDYLSLGGEAREKKGKVLPPKACASGLLTFSTSGTTGQPKPVRRKPGITAFLGLFSDLLQKLELHKYNSLLLGVPLFHGYGFAAFLVSLVLGKKVYLRPKWKTEKLLEMAKGPCPDVWALVPTQVFLMAQKAPELLAKPKAVLCGGAPFPPAWVEGFLARSPAALFNLYGTSEAGVLCLANRDDLQANPRCVGRPLRGVRIFLEETSCGKEVHYRSPISASGASGLASTGDLGRWDGAGRLELLGRKDDLVVSGGENIYPAEVIHWLLKQEEIADAAVFGVPDEIYGQGLQIRVVLEAGFHLSEGVLRQRFGQKAPPHWRPKEVRFCADLPRNELGKLRRTAE